MNSYIIGIDLGSTTAKVVLTDISEKIVYSNYIRHNTKIAETLILLLNQIESSFGNIVLNPVFTGSAGMGIAERTHHLFVQEVIAVSTHVGKLYPEVSSLIDIGGEDSKLVLFNDLKAPDIRMNGNCAGGTGAYIDQMAVLLNVSITELNELAWQSTRVYPIASRCGVFAKTDVQNLLSRKISKADIAASIFDAVASQTVNSLARGCNINPSIIFCGGPLTYISYLRESFSKLLQIDAAKILLPQQAQLFTALGAALSNTSTYGTISISDFIQQLNSSYKTVAINNTLNALFDNSEEMKEWQTKKHIIAIEKKKTVNGESCFLGIDSGSTTTKIVITDHKGCVLYSYYDKNDGRPLETVIKGLDGFCEQLDRNNLKVCIAKAAVTGYGEELIKSALSIDFGVVETVAHYVAAKHIDPQVSFILDIGGQDMKAIYVRNDAITNIEINEACSSGCGSFIEGFANTLGFEAQEFANLAIKSKTPYDLGSRCTVFMNSKVKQALSEGASVEDLSAGLAYSVIKNCLYKVLRIKSASEIGDNIVVQGGTFRNIAVFRCLEILSGKKVIASDSPELMGAYGAALYAQNKYRTDKQLSTFVGFNNLSIVTDFQTKFTICKGCTNNCQVTTYKFPFGGSCFSGNKCEKVFLSNSDSCIKGQNIFDFKKQILFNRPNWLTQASKLKIGIPRILNIYENYPFWHALITTCGFSVTLSEESNYPLYNKGIGETMSDNICFPAKLAHGHIANLIEKKVDRIFYPFVVYEKKAFSQSSNSYNCPIVTGYSELLKNVCETPGIPFDSPSINFNDQSLLKQACWDYLRDLGTTRSVFNKAFNNALKAQSDFRKLVLEKNIEIYKSATNNNKPIVLIASHPYHMDNLIHQQVSQILVDFGVNVINEDIAIPFQNEVFDQLYNISQWEYPNRILQSAWWVSKQNTNIGLVQLNSFGCGPDAFIVDEINDLTRREGITYALLRIDEISSPGSVKLRLRSLIESLKLKQETRTVKSNMKDLPKEHRIFTRSDHKRTILAPWFSDFYSPLIPALGEICGYKIDNLPPSDLESVKLGLEYANNEVCYPATLVVGDIIKALKSNKYKFDDIAIGITQTGGQCRATNYISLIKRAMNNAGFSRIPLVAIAPSKGLYNSQPGFAPNWFKLIKPAFIGLLFSDCLSKLYYSTACREIFDNESFCLKEKYINRAKTLLAQGSHDDLLPLLYEAIQDFNSIKTNKLDVKTVGIVGEIYIKYNTFGQFHFIDWLVKNHVEVILPPLMEFFMQSFVNMEARTQGHINRSNIFASFLDSVLKRSANFYIDQFENALKSFRFYRPAHNINHSAHLASEILNLNNQYGEGWLIPAEIISLTKQNINNIICVQPFGCIANHIVGKGMEKRIRDKYPYVNLLFLDFDYGTSNINILNRLHFLLQNKIQNTNYELTPEY